MDFGKFHFGSIEIDGVSYEHDVVIDRGKVRVISRGRMRIRIGEPIATEG